MREMIRYQAFSLLETLIVLVITGILLSFNLGNFGVFGMSAQKNALAGLRTDIREAVHSQATLPRSKFLEVPIPTICDGGVILVGAGGIVRYTELKCGSRLVSINSAGGFDEN